MILFLVSFAAAFAAMDVPPCPPLYPYRGLLFPDACFHDANKAQSSDVCGTWCLNYGNDNHGCAANPCDAYRKCSSEFPWPGVKYPDLCFRSSDKAQNGGNCDEWCCKEDFGCEGYGCGYAPCSGGPNGRELADILLASKGQMSCPGGYMPLSGEEMPCGLDDQTCKTTFEICRREAQGFGATFDPTQLPEWDGSRPSGCFEQIDASGKKTWYFNYKYSGGNYYATDRRVCRKNPDGDIFIDETGADMRIAELSEPVQKSGWLNEPDEEMKWKAQPGYFQIGFESLYSAPQMDRRFQMLSAYVPGDSGDGLTHHEVEEYENYMNIFGYALDFECPIGKAVIGWNSEHMDSIEDRRWMPTCAKGSIVRISPWSDHFITTPWTSSNAATIRGNVHVTCPSGTVVCGMRGSYNGDEKIRDRAYQLKCCRMWLYDPSVCAILEIKVDDFRINHPPQPEEVIVDSLNGANCGANTPLTFNVARTRSKTREFEETLELSETISSSFEKKVTTSLKLYAEWAVGAGGIAEKKRGFESNTETGFTWKSETSRTEKRMERKKTVEQETFTAGYTYTAPAGQTTTLKAVSRDFTADVWWSGVGKCYSKTGLLLEAKRMNGTYKGAVVGETTVVIDQSSCEEDAWTAHDNTYCNPADWLRDPRDEFKFLYANSKKAATDTCLLHGECQCVIDRGCVGKDKVDQLKAGGLSALWDELHGNFVLCKSGCETRLEPSKHSCTLTYDQPTCRCKHSGGGPLANVVECTDNTKYTCGAEETCEEQPDYGFSLGSLQSCPKGFHKVEATKMPCFLGEGSCEAATRRCEAAALELGLDFSLRTDVDEALLPSGCYLWPEDNTVRFNEKTSGRFSGRRAHRMVCGRDRLLKSAFEKSRALCRETGCFMAGKALVPMAAAPPAVSFTNWGDREPNYVVHGKEECVVLHPLDYKWHDVGCPTNVRPTAPTICGSPDHVDAPCNPEFPYHGKLYPQLCYNDAVRAESDRSRCESFCCIPGQEATCETLHNCGPQPCVQDGYLQGSYTVLDKVAKTRAEALEQCREAGLPLPSVWSSRDNERLAKLTQGEPIWLALNDRETENSYLWDQYSKVNPWDDLCWKSYPDMEILGSERFAEAAASTLKEAESKCDAEALCTGVTCVKPEECFLRTGGLSAKAGETSYVNIKCQSVTVNPDNQQTCLLMTNDRNWASKPCSEEIESRVICGTRGAYLEIPTTPGMKFTWKAAKELCREIDQPLAVVRSELEHVRFAEIGNGAIPAWVGLTDWRQDGQWVWDTSKPATYFEWAKGEPNHLVRKEQCVHLTDEGLWNDNVCDVKFSMHIICMTPGKKLHRAPEKTTSTYHEAREYCQDQGMMLPIVLSGLEAMAVRMAAQGETVWIGLTDPEGDETWAWETLDANRVFPDRVFSPEACQKVCAADAACNHYTWTKAEHKCELMENVESEEGTEKAGAVSGPAVCPSRRRLLANKLALRLAGL